MYIIQNSILFCGVRMEHGLIYILVRGMEPIYDLSMELTCIIID